MRSFKVDEVQAVESKIPLTELQLDALLDAKVVAKSASLERCVDPTLLNPFHGMNGLVLTVHRAFGEHRPLTLSPDDVWMAILQGFAIHVRENAESLRERFVDFSGPRRTLSFATEDLSDWPANLRGFERALADALNPGLMRALTSDFTTTSSDTHVAFCIAAMDAFSKYFDYELVGICGIPRVTLAGTVEDWRSLRDRFRVLAEFDLKWWSKKLTPVLDQFIATASGEVDVEFWQSIYKPKEAYGGETISGWIVRLFPYFEWNGVFTRSPLKADGWVHEQVPPRALPRGLSTAHVRMGGDELLSLHSGFFGVQQLPDCSLAPLIGWTVSQSAQERLFDALAQRHALVPPLPNRSWTWGPASVPAALIAFNARFGGGSLYGGELELLPPPPEPSEDARGWMRCSQFVKFTTEIAGERPLAVLSFGLHFASLRDGRRLVWFRKSGREPERVLLMGKDDGPGPHQVIANSFLELLQRLSNEAQFPPWEVKGTWVHEP